MTSIVILGASGHIGKSLLFSFLGTHGYRVSCYVRSKEKLSMFLSEIGREREVESYDTVEAALRYKHDVVVNCVGVGTPELLRKIGPEILSLTESFDNMILKYLDTHPESLYLNFSSGAVYGTEFSNPVDSSSGACIPINGITPTEYYRTAKIYSEVKHRALSSNHIIDLRVFSYFSRFMDLSSSYLIPDLIDCCKSGRPFITDSSDVVRDYIHPTDLFEAIEVCVRNRVQNSSFDLYSKAPLGKWELVKLFESKYGLEVQTSDAVDRSVTGTKTNYFSLDRRLETLGYSPTYSSIEAVAAELDQIIEARHPKSPSGS